MVSKEATSGAAMLKLSWQPGYQRLTANPIETLLGHETVESISTWFNKSTSSLFYDLEVPIALLLQYR